MKTTELIEYLEERYAELHRLSGLDNAKPIEWYDGAQAECKRLLRQIINK